MGFPFSGALLFLVLAGALTAYAFWIYTRVELTVPAARGLAVVRSLALIVLLLLLFDPRMPADGPGGVSARWALLDASLSMNAAQAEGASPWAAGVARAQVLQAEGWNVVRFGAGGLTPFDPEAAPDGLVSELAPALQAAAESGAREVRVLSDLRFTDGVAVRAAVESMGLGLEFEDVSASIANAGIARFDVPDVLRPDDRPVAEVEVYGSASGDSVEVEIFEEERLVETLRIAAPSAGLRSTASVELPVSGSSGRVRYSARIVEDGANAVDGFPDDNEVVTYTSVGFEAGALVLVSVRPDWEPRYLLPVLEEVTGLPALGYLWAGPDRFVRLGRAVDRGQPADSADVRRAVADAALLVVHGLGTETDDWVTTMAGRPGRRLVLPADPAGARAVGVEVATGRPGEWYASPDIPTSPIAGSLAGISLQGLPPLSDVMVAASRPTLPPLQLQLRGAGAPESAFYLLDRPEGRVAVALASGFWRWSMREDGREPYRRMWSGIAGWLLADERVTAAEARPAQWVVERGAAVEWSVPGDSLGSRIVVQHGDDVVVDTTVAGGSTISTGVLPPGSYQFVVLDEAGDTATSGRFDVAASTLEMLPAPVAPEIPARVASLAGAGDALGRPLRTFPWPYLLVIVLLCGEWVVRRRSGLR